MQHTTYQIDPQWQPLKAISIDDVPPQPRSPLTVSASLYSPPSIDYQIHQERQIVLPMFADLIRASQLANNHSLSPLPSLAKTSLGFILSGCRAVAQKPSCQSSERDQSASSEDDGSDGRASVSSPTSLGSLSPSESTKRKSRPASRTCKFEGCKQYVVDHGLCVRHGGGKRCTMDGCSSRAKHYGRCWRHGGSMECKIDGCLNRAKSRGYCWSHGGGTKCKADECEKIAISNSLCWAHGGGKRCAKAGCMKQAYERTNNFCNSHFQQNKRESHEPSTD